MSSKCHGVVQVSADLPDDDSGIFCDAALFVRRGFGEPRGRSGPRSPSHSRHDLPDWSRFGHLFDAPHADAHVQANEVAGRAEPPNLIYMMSALAYLNLPP